MAKTLRWLTAPLLVLLAGLAFSADREARRDHYLQPERVMDSVGLEDGMHVGEIGAGDGYFTVKLARRVGPNGRVFANDISRSALDDLEARCDEEELRNVRAILGGAVDPRLPEDMDMVFFVYSLHDIDDPVALLRNLRKVLDAEARLWVLDQDPAVSGDDHFLNRGQVDEIFSKAGYRAVGCKDFLERDLLCGFRP